MQQSTKHWEHISEGTDKYDSELRHRLLQNNRHIGCKLIRMHYSRPTTVSKVAQRIYIPHRQHPKPLLSSVIAPGKVFRRDPPPPPSPAPDQVTRV